jgi:ABC-type dipeptide/oligopeptide/nickel transport system permease component
MLGYAARRIAWTLPVVLVSIALAFVLVRATGGDPSGTARSST